MGGSALKVFTRRYDRVEYNRLAKKISKRLSLLGVTHHITTSYKNKKDFGDMDVLINKNDVDCSKKDFILRHFSPKEIFSNGDVCSFDHNDFQIDFIFVEPQYWESSKNYFSYNDLGNFIGRISYKMGFRFGDYGLKLVYLHEDGGKKFQKNISTDPEKIYEFLGFDYNRYLDGFDELDDIFEYITNSKYFNKTIFAYENLNHTNRTRNKKRKNYELFLKYVEDNSDVLLSDYVFKSKEYYVELAEKHFGVELNSQIKRWKSRVDIEKKASMVFNGNVIMEYFPLRGRELGEAIVNFKEYMYEILPTINEEEKSLYFSRWIVDNNLKTILELFAEVNNLNKEYIKNG